MGSKYKIKDFIPDPLTHKERWLVHDIREGGMGWVYIVYDTKVKDVLAVKTYKDDMLFTETSREQFKKEALIWIDLGMHENITKARYIEEIDHRIYLFLEYIAGGDLSQYIGTNILDIKQIIKFALQFCYGMEHAITIIPYKWIFWINFKDISKRIRIPRSRKSLIYYQQKMQEKENT